MGKSLKRLVSGVSLILLLSCSSCSKEDDSYKKSIGTNSVENIFNPTYVGSYDRIHEFTYRSHQYIGFPNRTTHGHIVLSIVHDPDCEKCLTKNNNKDEKEISD